MATPTATDKKNSRSGAELLAVFVVGGVAGWYLSRFMRPAGQAAQPAIPANQHWHSSRLQITAPGYAHGDTSDDAALAELEGQYEEEY